MALSNYLLQSVICTTIFYGHGLGLFGRVDRTGQFADRAGSLGVPAARVLRLASLLRCGAGGVGHALARVQTAADIPALASCGRRGLNVLGPSPDPALERDSRDLCFRSCQRAYPSLPRTEDFAARGDAGGARPHRRGEPRRQRLRHRGARDLRWLSARRATRMLGRKATRLPLLHGVPVSIKDLFATKGIRTTWGSLIYEDHVPDGDDLVVQRLKAAGAIVVGKTNTPEFGAGGNTFNAVFGATRNPWNTALSCGGSSGGAAVAVATGMGPLAQGSDLGGSLRTPAAFLRSGWLPHHARARPHRIPGRWSGTRSGSAGRSSRTVGRRRSHALGNGRPRRPRSALVRGRHEPVRPRGEDALDQGLADRLDTGSPRAHPGRRRGGPGLPRCGSGVARSGRPGRGRLPRTSRR